MTCDNPDCMDGWVEVDPVAYADRIIPDHPDALPTERAAAAARRASIARSMTVRPCGDCRPAALVRWANGCHRPGHRASACDLCVETMGEDAARRADKRGTR